MALYFKLLIFVLLAPHFAFAFRSMYLAVNKGFTLPSFSWRRYADAEGKTGGIELTTETFPKNIYGWVMDNRNNARWDFRIVGVRGNEEGVSLHPEYAELPEGYPDKAPSDEYAKKFKRVPDRHSNFHAINEEFIECEEYPEMFELDSICEYFKQKYRLINEHNINIFMLAI